jgi:heme/copper-type cytochrome/quinol oxidase subunit 2
MSKPGYADQGFWFRVIFMLLYWVVLNIAVTVFGILLVLVSLVKLGSKHEPVMLSSWLKSITSFIKQIFSFLSFETEEKPFPFQPWPQVSSDEEA